MADSGGSKTQTVQSVQNTAPWGPTQPGLEKAIKDIGGIYDSGGFNVPYYPGQTIADTAPETSQGWQSLTDTAKDPSKGVGAAQDYNNAILRGDYSALDPMISRIKDSVGSTYEAAGRYGSGYHDRAVADSVGNLLAGASAQAVQAAPGLQSAAYAPGQALLGVGQDRQQTAQDQINEAIKKYNYDKTSQINAANAYMQALSGNWGGTTVGTQPVQSAGSSWQDYFGAGLGLGGLALSAYGAFA